AARRYGTPHPNAHSCGRMNKIPFSLGILAGRSEGRTMVEWFDDLKVGMRFKSESKAVSKEEILRFAGEFDPQPFHTDEEAAKDTILNGLAASGWHTAAIAMRLAIAAR